MSGERDLQHKLLLSMNDKLTRVEVSVGTNTSDLKEHIRRTNILESKVNVFERLIWMGGGGSAVIYFLLKLAKVI